MPPAPCSLFRRARRFLLLAASGLAASAPLCAQDMDDGPREVPLVEKTWEQLPNHDVSQYGAEALAIDPKKWMHAETDNFIIHFRRVTEAHKVAREIEYDIWFIAKTLGATKEQYERKSNVFVFEDEDEWKSFIAKTNNPPWVASFARGDELFLNVRRSEATGRFDSETLAHETTHAVVARLFPTQRWPLWLSEGFAEYMAGASVAARKNQPIKSHQRTLFMTNIPLDKMTAMTQYPDDPIQVAALYQSAEKLVRFIMNDLPKDRFLPFVAEIVAGKPLQTALTDIYGDQFKDYPAFEKKYERFQK